MTNEFPEQRVIDWVIDESLIEDLVDKKYLPHKIFKLLKRPTPEVILMVATAKRKAGIAETLETETSNE